MSEKEMFLGAWDRESRTTMKILKQLPLDKADFKPTAEKTKSAKDLATIFIAELGVAEGVVNGQVDFTAKAPTFASYPEVLTAFESMHKAMMGKVKGMSEQEWNSTMAFPVGPKQMGQVRRADILWMMLMDGVHHRGQFSIYLRLVGAKVPSIYGPSADEPWM